MGHNNEEKEIQQQFVTLQDIYAEWRNKLDRVFYILLSNGDLMYFFHIKQKIKKGKNSEIDKEK